MKIAVVVLAVGIALILLAVFIPQDSPIQYQPYGTALSTNSVFPSYTTGNLSDSMHFQQHQSFIISSTNFVYTSIDFNQNHAILNGVTHPVTTLVNVTNGVVTVTIYLHTSIPTGNVTFVFDFVADFVLYGTSTNYLHNYKYTSPEYYFSVHSTNYIMLGVGVAVAILGTILILKRV